MIRVWYYDIRNFESSSYDSALNALPQNIQMEIVKYRFNEDRHIRLISKLLVQKALIALNLSPQLIQGWARDKNNKPFLKDWGSFNISHSGDYVVLCFSEGNKVGVDIEKHNRSLEVDSLSDMFCTTETAAILSAKDKHAFFFNLWTRKEAILKAVGVGLLNGIDEFDCTTDEINIGLKKWYLREFDISHGYSTCIAADFRFSDIEVTPITFLL